MTNTAPTTTAPKFTVRPAGLQQEVPGADGRVACRCSTECKAATWNYFAQGHDAKLVSKLIDETVQGRLTLDEAKQVVRTAGGDERLVSKLVVAVGKAHDRWTKRMEAAEKRAAAKAAKQYGPRKVSAKVGRWTYDGTLRGETFVYSNRSGKELVTTRFTLV